MLLALSAWSTAALAEPSSPSEAAAREAILREQRERELRRQQEAAPDVRLPRAIERADQPWPQEQPCFPIRSVLLVGQQAERFAFALQPVTGGAAPALGRCLGGEGVALLASRVQNAIVDRGYVTTRVLVEPQDLKSGQLRLTVVPGRLHQVRFAEGTDEARATAWNAVPRRADGLLNLRDVEQALENFKRVPTTDAYIDIEPSRAEGSGPGDSDLVIRWHQATPWRLQASIDDGGSRATGKYQGALTLSYDHWWTLNDLFYVSINRDLGGGEPGERGTRGHTVHYSVPSGYWLFGITAGAHRYHQAVAGASQTYLYRGENRTGAVKVSRLVGTQVQAAGPVTLAAGRDLTARAASVSSEQGALVAQAGRDLTLQAGSSRQLDEEARYVKKKGLVSSKRTTTYDRVEHTGAQATTFSGATVHLSAGQDLAVVGSQVASDHATTLVAGRDVTLQAATETLHEQHFKETKKSGLFSSGATLTVGTQQKSLDARASQSRAAASTVGSVEGDVRIQAGGTYRQSGSDVLAPQGDIDLAAQRLEITEAAETHTTRTEQRFKQSGLSVGVGGALVTAAQTTAQMAQAAQRTTDPRMQALAAAAAGLHLYNNAGEIGQAAEALAQGDVSRAASLQISVGSAHSRSVSETQATEARASTVAAGGHVRLQASGAGAGSDLIVRGSDVRAGGHAWLRAEGDIDLLAAERTRHERSQQRSSSASVGISVGASTGVTASASRGRGQGQGDETTWRSTHVQAGQQVTLTSGADTTLRGAVAAAEQVQARVGGNLTVHSLQDTATYDERHRQAGGSVTLGPGPGASVSAGATRIRSDYASVTEQSALRAGDGGFDVQVAGTTTLVGSALTSTEAAVLQGRNRFDSQALVLSDVHNQASYEAKSSGVNIGMGGGKLGGSAGIGHASGQASSTTQAAISGIAGKQEARTGDAETGLAPIFDRERVKQDVQAQVAITAEFGKQASQAVGDYAHQQEQRLREQARNAPSDEERQALLAEADQWAEGGAYRVAAHVAVGGLSGGLQGALGAGASAAAAQVLNDLTADLPVGVRQGVGAGVAAALGALAGGPTGAATAFNADVNNRQLHPSEKQLAKDLARRSNGRYTAEQIEEQMRLMGNKALGVAPNTVETLTSAEAIAQNLVNDPSMPKAAQGPAVMELPGQADVEIQQFILDNTTDNVATWIPGSSPYMASRSDLAPTHNAGPVGPSTPPPAICANMDLGCKSGVGASQIPALTPEQRHALAKYLSNLNAQYSRAASISIGSGNVQAVLALEVAAAVVGVMEQMIQPSAGKVVVDAGIDTAVDIVARRTGIPKAFVFEVAEKEVRPRLEGLQTQIDNFVKRDVEK